MTHPLLPEFPPVSKEQWREAAEKALRGKSPDDLIWTPEKGIDIAPYYHPEDLEGLSEGLDSQPGQYPFRRGNAFQIHGPGWQIVQELYAESLNSEWITHALKNEARAISITGFQETPSPEDVFTHLKAFDFSGAALHLHLNQPPVMTVLELVKSLRMRKIRKHLLTGTLWNDPISMSAAEGNSVSDVSMGNCEGGMINARNLPNLRALGLDFSYIHDMGGSIVQELAFALSTLVDYLDYFEETESVLSRKEILSHVAVTFSLGTGFFPEIAKLRAFRILFSKVVSAYGIREPELQSPFLMVRTSRSQQTVYDRHNNLLRATTSAMSGIIGGANAIMVTGYDQSQSAGNAQSARLARNIQHLLKYESYLDQVSDPAGGSYYVEILTDKIAKAAWELFRKIEKLGGFSKLVKEGLILKMLEESAEKKDRAFAHRRSVIVGSNHYPNPAEKLETAPERDFYSPFEALRFQMDQSEASPKAYLLAFGDLKMRNARSQYSRNLLGCLGIEIVESSTPEDLSASITEAKKLQPEIVVLCSADETYQAEGKELISTLKEALPKTHFLIAGKPENIQDLGADNHFYQGMNALDFLNHLSSRLLSNKNADI